MSPLSPKGSLDSLPNLIVFLWVYLSLPVSLLNAAFAYQDGELTLGRMLRILLACSCGGIAMAFIGWYVAFAAIIRRRKQNRP
jgi:hypothetical protein